MVGGWVGGWMGGWVGGLVGAWVIGGWKAGGGMVSKCSQSAYLMKEQVCDLAAHFAFYRSAWLHILLSAGQPGGWVDWWMGFWVGRWVRVCGWQVAWLGGWVDGWLWLDGGVGGCKVGSGMVSICSQSAYLMKKQVCDLAAHFTFYRS